MAGFFRSLFGSQSPSTKRAATSKQKALRSQLVQEWSSLNDEQGRLDENWSIQTNSRWLEITNRKRVIESACIASHTLGEGGPSPDEALEACRGRSLKRALTKDYDDTALVAFCALLVQQFNSHYPQLADQFIEACGREIDAMPEANSDTARKVASELIFRFLASFYEIGALRTCGKPWNVFVSANVRNVFAGLLHRHVLRAGYNDPGREWAEESLSNFVDGHKRNLALYFEETESHLSQVFAMEFSGGTADVSPAESRMGAELDHIFAKFVQSNMALIRRLLDDA